MINNPIYPAKLISSNQDCMKVLIELVIILWEIGFPTFFRGVKLRKVSPVSSFTDGCNSDMQTIFFPIY